MKKTIRRQVRFITQGGVCGVYFSRFIHQEGREIVYGSYLVNGVSNRRLDALVQEIAIRAASLVSVKRSRSSVEFVYLFPPVDHVRRVFMVVDNEQVELV